MKGGYIKFEIYECPKNPAEHGEYIGSTPVWEQAQAAAAKGDRMIKGVTTNGDRVLLL